MIDICFCSKCNYKKMSSLSEKTFKYFTQPFTYLFAAKLLSQFSCIFFAEEMVGRLKFGNKLIPNSREGRALVIDVIVVSL